MQVNLRIENDKVLSGTQVRGTVQLDVRERIMVDALTVEFCGSQRVELRTTDGNILSKQSLPLMKQMAIVPLTSSSSFEATLEKESEKEKEKEDENEDEKRTTSTASSSSESSSVLFRTSAVINVGRHEFQFKWLLPREEVHAGSFRYMHKSGSMGLVQYTGQAILLYRDIESDGAERLRETSPLVGVNVLKSVDPLDGKVLLPLSDSQSTSFMFGSGHLSVTVALPRRVFALSSALPLRVSIANTTTTELRSIDAALMSTVELCDCTRDSNGRVSITPPAYRARDVVARATLMTNVAGQRDDARDFVVDVPENLSPTIDGPLVRQQYQLVVTVVVGAVFGTNLVLKLPVYFADPIAYEAMARHVGEPRAAGVLGRVGLLRASVDSDDAASLGDDDEFVANAAEELAIQRMAKRSNSTPIGLALPSSSSSAASSMALRNGKLIKGTCFYQATSLFHFDVARGVDVRDQALRVTVMSRNGGDLGLKARYGEPPSAFSYDAVCRRHPDNPRCWLLAFGRYTQPRLRTGRLYVGVTGKSFLAETQFSALVDLKAASQCTHGEGTSLGDSAFIETVFENERRLTLFSGYAYANLFASDPAHFSDRIGNGQPPPHDFRLPDFNWRWQSDWAIEPWRYAFSFSAFADSSLGAHPSDSSATSYVRRRQWQRTRVIQSREEKQHALERNSSSSDDELDELLADFELIGSKKDRKATVEKEQGQRVQVAQEQQVEVEKDAEQERAVSVEQDAGQEVAVVMEKDEDADDTIVAKKRRSQSMIDVVDTGSKRESAELVALDAVDRMMEETRRAEQEREQESERAKLEVEQEIAVAKERLKEQRLKEEAESRRRQQESAQRLAEWQEKLAALPSSTTGIVEPLDDVMASINDPLLQQTFAKQASTDNVAAGSVVVADALHSEVAPPAAALDLSESLDMFEAASSSSDDNDDDDDYDE
jgi:Arrestin (or S-antigen), C-terminal domain